MVSEKNRKFFKIFNLIVSVIMIVTGGLLILKKTAFPLAVVFIFGGLMSFIHNVKRPYLRIILTLINVAAALYLYYILIS